MPGSNRSCPTKDPAELAAWDTYSARVEEIRRQDQSLFSRASESGPNVDLWESFAQNLRKNDRRVRQAYAESKPDAVQGGSRPPTNSTAFTGLSVVDKLRSFFSTPTGAKIEPSEEEQDSDTETVVPEKKSETASAASGVSQQ